MNKSHILDDKVILEHPVQDLGENTRDSGSPHSSVSCLAVFGSSGRKTVPVPPVTISYLKHTGMTHNLKKKNICWQ